MTKNTLLLLLTILVACSSEQGITLQIKNSTNNVPIEGTVIYVKNHRFALRSDVNGDVTIPDEFSKETISVEAKNYHSQNINLSNFNSKDVLMQFDTALVNPFEAKLIFTKKDSLQGTYGPYRSNNDLLNYSLTMKFDIDKKFILGDNKITFKMLKDGDQIQIDLFENLSIDKIVFDNNNLGFERDQNAVFIKFPKQLKKGDTYKIDFFFSGEPKTQGRFGGITFGQDSLGNPWVYTACQGVGSSIWWPSKDQPLDEVENMSMHYIVPSELTAVANGKFEGQQDLGDGFTQYNWIVQYPINNYTVSVNIGKYTHFSDTLNDLDIDYYVMPYHFEQAKIQFKQAISMLKCYQKYFGEYPFKKDGYKLVEVPYSGMEHQSAVTYGNLFQNGYLGRDWTGVGISLKFDFIIIHESAHEWFGNCITCGDYADAWIHEAFGTYMEAVYVEEMFGYDEAMKYINGYQGKVANRTSPIGIPGVNYWPTQDIYFKGALFLNTLRHVVNDDTKWWDGMLALRKKFEYKNIYTADVLNFFNEFFNKDFKPLFDQYLYSNKLPVLQLKFIDNEVQYRWDSDIQGFDMPIKVMKDNQSTFIYPTSEWKKESLIGLSKENWKVETDLFFVIVKTIE